MVSLQWLVVVDRGVQQAAAPQGRHQALTYLVGLFHVRVTGQHELVDAECVVLGDPLRHFVVAADQTSPSSAARLPTAPTAFPRLRSVRESPLVGRNK